MSSPPSEVSMKPREELIDGAELWRRKEISYGWRRRDEGRVKKMREEEQ